MENDTVLDYAPSQHDYHSDLTANEQLLCGDEHSVVARFDQNIGHVMTSVIRSCRHIDIHFGDFKAAAPQSGFVKVPDIAVMNSNGKIFVLGEAKTPWVHDIGSELQVRPAAFRKYLGRHYTGHIH